MNQRSSYRTRSFWLEDVPGELEPRPSLPGPTAVDVAIVGAGFTGLWTAYYLARADPRLRIAVIEKEIAGFGGSGRNGGWCSASHTGISHDYILKKDGRDAARAVQQAMFATVDEVGDIVAREGIDCDYLKAGELWFAANNGQLGRVREQVDRMRRLGIGDEDSMWLDAGQVRARVRVSRCLGAWYTPRSASIQPARLARGLADVVERLGVAIFERTPALALERGAVTTPMGRVAADVVVQATEAFTAGFEGRQRDIAPIYTFVVATDRLPQAFWDEVGWQGRETFMDGRRAIFYAMRSREDRIVMGGLHYPYHYGSRLDERFEYSAPAFGALHQMLLRTFPALRGVALTHRWGGPVGCPRDFFSSVGLDRPSGIAWAGGYVGDGVATSNLAGRTLRDLILRRDTELVRLAWVGHRSPRWEPEPVRWLEAQLIGGTMAFSDAQEDRSGKPSRVGAVADFFGI
ncbi:MAG: FAD-dependent oxidoreductase [Actinobacteria bacterium]|nr:FAD-dependent oxidoreductase [Actinomycetota bacterium]